MRLSRLKALLPLAALTVACHETTSPPPPGGYFLETVNNAPLPIVLIAGGGDTITLVSEALTLVPGAHAMPVTRTRQVTPTIPPLIAAATPL